MIHILFEGMTSSVGGKETYILNTYNALDKSKYKSYFIAYDSEIAHEEYLKNTGATIIHLPARNKGYTKHREALNHLFDRYTFDVFWAHKTTLSASESLQVAKKNNVPVRIVHSHSSANMGNALTYVLHSLNKFFIHRWTTDFLACSETASKWFYGNRPSLIVRNAIDLEKYRFDEQTRHRIRNKLNLNNKKVIGHVGRFGAEKNHSKLISVFNVLHKNNPNTVLVLCGDGEEREKIEEKIRHLNLTEDVLMLGNVDNVHEILQAMDVFVMPSLFEGLPFALMEAQAAGLKCIVSDTVSDESDIMKWNKFIPLSASDDEWANQIEQLDLSYKREIGYEVLKEENYGIQENLEKILKLVSKK